MLVENSQIANKVGLSLQDAAGTGCTVRTKTFGIEEIDEMTTTTC